MIEEVTTIVMKLWRQAREYKQTDSDFLFYSKGSVERLVFE